MCLVVKPVKLNCWVTATSSNNILVSAGEVKAIEKITSLGIATTPLVAYGQRGTNPATLQSFVLTEDLGDITSLEDLCADWVTSPPNPRFKRQLIAAAAKLTKTIHEAGVNHRDFYLCHLCLDNQDAEKINLYLIDLHRVLIHQVPSMEANMKDVAALYFSSMDSGFTTRDYLRFKYYYQQQPDQFWQQVETRAQKLYAKFNSETVATLCTSLELSNQFVVEPFTGGFLEILGGVI